MQLHLELANAFGVLALNQSSPRMWSTGYVLSIWCVFSGGCIKTYEVVPNPSIDQLNNFGWLKYFADIVLNHIRRVPFGTIALVH